MIVLYFIFVYWHVRTHPFTISIIRMNWEIESSSTVLGGRV